MYLPLSFQCICFFRDMNTACLIQVAPFKYDGQLDFIYCNFQMVFALCDILYHFIEQRIYFGLISCLYKLYLSPTV